MEKQFYCASESTASAFIVKRLQLFLYIYARKSCEVLGFFSADIDFRMKSPLEECHRTARLVPRSKFQLLFDAFQYRRYLKPIYDIVFYPDSLMARSVSPVQEFAQVG